MCSIALMPFLEKNVEHNERGIVRRVVNVQGPAVPSARFSMLTRNFLFMFDGLQPIHSSI